MHEQRRHRRKPLDVDLRCRDAAASGQLSFGTGDVSAGGAFLKSDLLFEQGDRLWLELQLPGRPEPVQAEVRVVWVRRFPGPGQQGGMGVEFQGMTDEDRRALIGYLET